MTESILYKELSALYEAQSKLLEEYRKGFNKLWDKWETAEECLKKATEKYSRELNSCLEDGNKRVADTVQHYENWIKSRSLALLTKRVVAWEMRVLGKTASLDRIERTMRLLEEVLELAQVEKLSVIEIDLLVKRIYSRPVGELSREVGGVMICAVAFAHAAKIDLMETLSKEVDRVEAIDPEVIREKQRQKWDAGVGLNPDDV